MLGKTIKASEKAILKVSSIGATQIIQTGGSEQLFDKVFHESIIGSGSMILRGSLVDANGSTGSAGQVPTSTGASDLSVTPGWQWDFPSSTGTGTITQVVAGDGLTGGGNSGGVTLNVVAGTGISATADQIAVDSTVVRTTGTQTIGGSKTFSSDTTITSATTAKLNITATNANVNPASTTLINLTGYENRGQGIKFLNTGASGEEWFAGLRYQGNFNEYVIGYDQSGGQAEYTTNTILGVSDTGIINIDGQSASIKINGANGLITTITSGSGGSMAIVTPNGTTRIGAENGSYSHFYTNRPKFYFNKHVIVDNGNGEAIFSSFDTDLFIQRGHTGDDRIKITSTNIGFFLDGVEDMRLENDGELHVADDVIAFSSTPSDSRLKDNIFTIPSALDKIKSLNGVSYTWNSGRKKGKKDIGLIAQEVEKIIPEIVKETKLPLMEGSDSNIDYKTIDYEKIIPVLIEAIKDQQDQIDKLKQQVNKGHDYGNY